MNKRIETSYSIWPEEGYWHWTIENYDGDNGVVISYKEKGRTPQPCDRLEVAATPETLLALGEAIIAKAKEFQERMVKND